MDASANADYYARELALTKPLPIPSIHLFRDELSGVITSALSPLAGLAVGKPTFALAVLAQTTSGSASQLTQGFGLALGVMFLFGFLWGVLKIWSGANAISKGDPDGKAGIIAGIIIAAAAAIMGALFAIFGLSGGVLTPSF